MKIAIASNSDDIDTGRVTRLGTCSHLLMVDSETMEYEAVPISPAEQGRGAGTRMVTLAAGHGAEVIMTSYVAPRMANSLEGSGIDLVTAVDGTVREAVEEYMHETRARSHEQPRPILGALRRSARQFGSMLPVLLGVMLLAGLLNVFVSREALASVFSGHPATDTLWGAVCGSIFGGNAVNSYVIGASLHEAGVSLFAVTALIITWVTVGLIQLPAEASALGARFAVLRNVTAFVISLGLATLTVLLTGWLE